MRFARFLRLSGQTEEVGLRVKGVGLRIKEVGLRIKEVVPRPRR